MILRTIVGNSKETVTILHRCYRARNHLLLFFKLILKDVVFLQKKVVVKLTFRLLKFFNEMSNGISGLVNNEVLHHAFK